MVMKKNMMARNLWQSILGSITRYIAIVLIIALGAGIFVGLRTTKSDMIATGRRYMDEQNMFDLRLLNTYGWTAEQVEQIRQMEGVAQAEGSVSLDVLAAVGRDGTEAVYKLHSIPEAVNKVYLLEGRLPEKPDECLADSHSGIKIGKTLTATENNTADTLDSLSQGEFTVVGICASPLYMDTSRGNTSLGNGTVRAFIYVPSEGFAVDYYTEIDVCLSGGELSYTKEYDNAMDSSADTMKLALEPMAQLRYENLLTEGQKAYRDGLAEYRNGLDEYHRGKADAEEELAEAKKKLEDGERELQDSAKLLADGERELQDGQKTLNASLLAMANSRRTLAEAKSEAYSQLSDANSKLVDSYKQVSQILRLVNDGLAEIDNGLLQLNSGIQQLENGLSQLDLMIGLTKTLTGVLDTSISAARSALDQAKELGVDAETIAQMEAELAALEERQAGYQENLTKMETDRESYSQQLTQLQAQRETIQAQRAELEDSRKQLEAAAAEIDTGFLELDASKTQAEKEFAAAEAKLEAGAAQLEAAQKELDTNKAELENGKLELAEGQQALKEGWQEYYDGEEKAHRELAEAKEKLDSAWQELEDGKASLDSMKSPSVYVLGRDTNVGYVALDSNSDIVQGVSAVFPAFFLLIAALVCITTMTRMVEEERTQIGTMKALGYTEWEIVSKYLIYAGSAALLGCGLGVFAGSVAFPCILWTAYGLIINIPGSLTLRLDWALCLAVVGAYTLISLAVTWYCCRRNMRDMPAELIRPRAPTSGKKIFLEKLPFWGKISFLNKVMLRNIFRYRQRLLMMLVGVGGCTALVLTAFGIRDSIFDIVSFQFENVTQYDMEIRFSQEMTPGDQEAFRQETDSFIYDMCFYHQSSVELLYGERGQDVSLIAADEDYEGFVRLRTGDRELSMPDVGEALVSVGVAEDMGIRPGDRITVRNVDMEELALTVSGVYDNYVYNYVIISPETMEKQWGRTPEVQMSCLIVGPNQDVHEAGAQITGMDHVMSLTICQDLADQVGSMMEAMDLVVVTVLICAALLAVIVTYNLTNINITERIREIATIKVLGFNSAESAAYVFKENLLLSAMGSVLGLAGGYWLLVFVMSQIRVSLVWMPARLMPVSYVLAIVLTMAVACAVDFLLYFRLEKINMAEALKSVE